MKSPFQPADLIFVSLEDWDDVWRRNQFVCDALARRHPNMRLLFVGLPRDFSHGLRRGNLDVLREPATASVPGLSNITIIRTLKLFPKSIPPARWINNWVYRISIRREARRLEMVGPTLWINPHSAGHLIGRLGERRVIYDITDDWELADVSPRRRAEIHKQDRDICKRADLVVVCSTALEKSRSVASKRLLLLPNGVDVDHYRRVSEPTDTTDSNDKKPIFGYTGTLHPDRIAIDMVLAVAFAFPEGTVYLIGPNELCKSDCERLRVAGNICITGPMRYQDLPAIMARFNVCIVPHVQSAFTESLNPIKLWEYLAAGKPIVSTPVAGFRDYPAFVRLAATPDAFVAACRESIIEGDSKTAARRDEALKHTWASRVDRLEQELAAVESPLKTDDLAVWNMSRIIAAVLRRLRLYRTRLCHRRVRFGSKCDVAAGFRSTVGPRGVVAFSNGCVIDRGMTVESFGAVSVGQHTIFGHHCTLAARASIKIGVGCMFAEMVSIRDHDHRFDDPTRFYRSQGFEVAPVVIGNNVWLGAKVSVLKGVTIGDNTVVGAHAVVTRDLPANVIAVGVPARVIRKRDQPLDYA